MCSNFGFNPHPSSTPCELQKEWAALFKRFFAYLRSKFRARPMTLEPSDKRPEALNVPRIRSK
ncbi:MAG: hypothetical protein ABR866_15890 [Candidatus Korobacteraceae bacterium]|jgi:hypothetical protein